MTRLIEVLQQQKYFINQNVQKKTVVDTR